LPDIRYIFGLAFVILALVGVFAVFRALSTQAKGGGPHGKRTTMGERGMLDVGSPIFPPPPEVVDINSQIDDSAGPQHGHKHHSDGPTDSGHSHGHHGQSDAGGFGGDSGGHHGHTDSGGFSGGDTGGSGGHHH
jgi:hypothetical protein